MRNGIPSQLKSRTHALFPGDNFESHTINATKANKSMTADIEIRLETKSMVVFFILKVKRCNFHTTCTFPSANVFDVENKPAMLCK